MTNFLLALWGKSLHKSFALDKLSYVASYIYSLKCDLYFYKNSQHLVANVPFISTQLLHFPFSKHANQVEDWILIIKLSVI